MPYRPPIHQPIPWRPAGANRSPPGDPFYHSEHWRDLRRAVLKRDRHVCQIRLPGCYTRASIADHIIERKAGGSDTLSNLRACCAACHNARHPHRGRVRDA